MNTPPSIDNHPGKRRGAILLTSHYNTDKKEKQHPIEYLSLER
jgi:hypothetical protein